MAKLKMNYRRNKKSILFSIVGIIVLIISILFIADIQAFIGENGNPAGGNGSSKCTNEPCYRNVYFGVRISYVDADGNRVAGTSREYIDLWFKNPLVSGFDYYTLPTMHSKNNLTPTNSSIPRMNAETFTTWCTLENNCTFANIEGYLWFYNFGSGAGYSTASGADGSAKSLVSYCSGKGGTEEQAKGCENNIRIYLNKYFDIDESLSSLKEVYDAGVESGKDGLQWVKDSLTDRYIQLEPLVTVSGWSSSKQIGFYGTISELTQFVDNHWYSKAAGWTIWGAVISDSRVGCGVYIDPNTQPIDKDNSENNKEDTKYRTSNFNSNTRCTGDRYTDFNLLQNVNGGAGITQIFFGDFVNIENKSDKCEDMVKYIHDNPSKYSGTEYDKAIAEVRDGTFNYTDGDGNKHILRGPQNFQLLDPTIYKDLSKNPSGKAACEGITEATCPADTFIDDCSKETGTSYFKDNIMPECWLINEIAYSTPIGQSYSSENTGHLAVEDTNGGIVGNAEYCELFCYEEVVTSFPTAVNEVKASQTFVWGLEDGTFGNIKIKKYCSNQSYKKGEQGYRFEEWEEDFKDNQKKQISNFLEWKYNEASNGKITTGTSGRCCIGSCGTKKNPRCCSRPTRYYARKTPTSGSHSDSWIGTIGEASDNSHYATSCSSASAAKAAVTIATGGYQSAYTEAKNNEQPLLVKIRQCTNNIKYVYETIVTFIFSEPVNSVYGLNSRAFSGEWELEIDPEKEEGYNKDNVNKSTCTPKTVYSYNCSGSGESASCTPITEIVLDCKQVTWDIEGEYIYSYPTEEFQWFSDKRDSTLVNKKNKPSGDEAYFYSIGFGLPTAFSLTNGKYEMAVVVGNLGDHEGQNYSLENGHFAPVSDIIRNVEINNNTISIDEVHGFEYKCTYNVENEIFGYDCVYEGNNLTGNSPAYCDEKKDNDSNGNLKGIDVAYRIVSLLNEKDELEKAFPGIDSSGRNIGDNWNKIGIDEIYKILDDDVYESLAMYEIMLDINAIRYIRKSNNEYFENGKDPYTSFVDENNHQKVYCKSKGANGEYKYCASEFLTELNTSSSLNYNLMGTCLPSGMGTEERAQHELDDECSNTYVYPEINWVR